MNVAIASPYDELTSVERPRYVVCNAGDEDIEKTVSSIIYRVPARGSIEIGDRMDYERDEKGAILRDKQGNIDAQKLVAGKGAGAAYNVVKVLFSPEPSFNAGDEGLYVLRGDGRDDEREAIARAKYVKARCARAAAAQERWHAIVAKSKSNVPMRMPKKLQADVDFLALHENGVVLEDERAPFISFDGRDFETREAAELYVQRVHPAVWETGSFEGKALIVERDAAAPRPIAAPVARPVDVVAPVADPIPEPEGLSDDEVEFITTSAIEYGVTLTKADLTGMLRGDRDVVDDITTRLADAAKALKKTSKKKDAAPEAPAGA